MLSVKDEVRVKVTVLTITWRPGYIDTMAQALFSQTMPKENWEWILVDDLSEIRHEAVANFVQDKIPNFLHLPPREIKPYSATATAVNTGLAQAQGELVYFMADYTYPHPRCLERHWEIFQRYGPKVLTIGPLVDGITLQGKSVFQGAPPVWLTVKVGDKLIQYWEHLPPVDWPLKPDFEQVRPENYISIFKKPFRPVWPQNLPPDWRLGQVCQVSVAPNVYETFDFHWWWGGRNDSASLAMLREVGGLEEANQAQHGGLEVEMVQKMMARGCRLLVDRKVPCYILPHPIRKREVK